MYDVNLGVGELVQTDSLVNNKNSQMYDVYIDGILLPITPSKLDISVNNKNKTYDLANGGEVNILKDEGLKTIKFDVLLPNTKYPFARYNLIYKPAIYYLQKIEELKRNKQPFQLIISRIATHPLLFVSNFKVSLESYTIEENAENGTDIMVSLVFKEFVEVVKKEIKVITPDVSGIKNSEKGKEYINKIKGNDENSNFKKAIIEYSRPINNENIKDTTVKTVKNIPLTARKYQGNTKEVNNILDYNNIKSTLIAPPDEIKLRGDKQ